MKVLVTGADGQLGRCIRDCATALPDTYIFTDIDTLDICDADAVATMTHDEAIDVIVNCAAYTNVDRAEDDVAAAERLNAIAVDNLAQAARDSGVTLIHISTDYVFGSSAGNIPLTEDMPASPTSVYGLTKLHGEQAIASSGVKAIILRTAWLYSEYGRNFVRTMLSLTATRPAVDVVFDQIGSPTYARDLATAITGMISRRRLDRTGIYHYSDEGICSWYDFAKTIAAMAGNTECRISPCHSHEFRSKAKRPAYSVLDKSKFKATFDIEIPYWVDSLAKCIDNLKSASEA